MRTFTFLLAFIAIGSPFVFLTAQSPVLTGANSNPFSGESWSLATLDVQNVGTYNPGQGGPNQTFDFSSATSSVSANLQAVLPATTPDGASFTNADICLENTTANNYDYYVANGTQFSRAGVAIPAANQIIPYSDPEDVLRYPFTLNDSFVDALASTYVSNGVTFVRAGNVTVTADAYGTLILPYGTFNNVLRVRVQEDYTDSFMGNPTLNYTSDIYNFHLPGTHIPLMNRGSFNSGFGTTEFGSFAAAGTVANVEAFLANASFFMYPNPATDYVQIHYSLAQKAQVSVQILNLQGQEVISRDFGSLPQGSHEFQLDLQGFAAGIYLLDLRVNGIPTLKRLQVQ